MTYQQRIKAALAEAGRADLDPRWIEAFMRTEYGTLDGLSAARFSAEVRLCAQVCDAAGALGAERCAQSWGL